MKALDILISILIVTVFAILMTMFIATIVASVVTL